MAIPKHGFLVNSEESSVDADVLAERILLDLKNTFKKDPLIDEFDILPVHESLCNKCPVIHLEHKVALEDWCVKHVYIYAYSHFLKWRKKPYKADPDALLSWTSAILLINPEIETAWNARKELVQKNLHVPESELKFTEIVLSRKPKSSRAFAHRKWVLLETNSICCSPKQVMDHELSLCTRLANLYPCNYYAWCHRIWVVKELLHTCPKILSEELVNSEQWLSTHVSDYSGFHYRQFLITSHDGTRDCRTCPLHADSFGEDFTAHDPLHGEMSFLCDLQNVFPGHETLWSHRRFVLSQFRRVSSPRDSDFSPEDAVKCKRHKLECIPSVVPDWGSSQEQSFLRQRVKLSKHADWEKQLIVRHVEWLRNVLAWSISLAIS